MDRTRAVQCTDGTGVLFVDRFTGEVLWRGRFRWGYAFYPGMDPWGDLRDLSWVDDALAADGFPWGTL